MEKTLKQILNKLTLLETNMEQRFVSMEHRLDSLEQLKPLVKESHQWIKVLVENKEIQKAEIDSLNLRVSKVEGVLTGFERSLEGMQKAQ